MHRLDRETSGLLLIAKKRSALTGLHSQMREGTTYKRYLALVKGDQADIAALQAAGVVTIHALQVKVILAGELKRKVNVVGLSVTKGARAAIEAAGGTINEIVVPPKVRKLPKKDKPKA